MAWAILLLAVFVYLSALTVAELEHPNPNAAHKQWRRERSTTRLDSRAALAPRRPAQALGSTASTSMTGATLALGRRATTTSTSKPGSSLTSSSKAASSTSTAKVAPAASTTSSSSKATTASVSKPISTSTKPVSTTSRLTSSTAITTVKASTVSASSSSKVGTTSPLSTATSTVRVAGTPSPGASTTSKSATATVLSSSGNAGSTTTSRPSATTVQSTASAASRSSTSSSPPPATSTSRVSTTSSLTSSVASTSSVVSRSTTTSQSTATTSRPMTTPTPSSSVASSIVASTPSTTTSQQSASSMSRASTLTSSMVSTSGVSSQSSSTTLPSTIVTSSSSVISTTNSFSQSTAQSTSSTVSPLSTNTLSTPSATSSTASISTSSPITQTTSSSFTTTSNATTTTATALPNSSIISVSGNSTSTITCAPAYTGGLTTISGTGTLPKPTAFVTRAGTQLQLSSSPYRIVGPNMYWLGLDENISPVAPPSKTRVREAMAIAVAMGANTIRSLSLGISLGSPTSIEPRLNEFNDSAFDSLDYALFAAREYGLRVILTLTDEYDFYTGGKYNFLRWLNESSDNDGSQFYTNDTVVATFENYINQIITRFNHYSKTYYYNDPTILAWETGNEFGGYIGKYGYPPLSFTDEIVRYIKSVDPNHLVIDGTDGFWNYTTKVVAPGVNSTYIDIMSDHLYPLNNPLMAKEQQIVTQYSKGFLIGEYDWTGLFGGSTSLASFISAVEATNYIGDMLWNVMGHDDQCCQYVVHNDGYSLYYPSGNPSLISNVLQVVQHWYRMTGRPAPTALPAVACPQPAF